jgi:hypothetical protein
MSVTPELIQALRQRLHPVDRGLSIAATELASIVTQIEAVEQGNPTPVPTAAVTLLDGNWRLLYTTSEELLGIGRFPLLTLGPVYQCIRVAEGRVYNIAELDGPSYLGGLTNGLVSVAASFEVTSDRRLTVQFERAVFGLRGLLGYQGPDQWIEALETDRRYLAADFRIKPREQPGWIELTYLDETLRINRGNNGSIFVLERC